MTVAAFSFDQAREITGGKFGAIDAPCPLCGPQRQSSINQRRKTLRLWCNDPNFITFHCARCEERGWTSPSNTARQPARSVDAPAIAAEIQRRENDEARERLKIAMSLWRRRVPSVRTIAEIYLRECRGYRGPLPATLGFLPASGDYPPAMIAAFGVARETLPGELMIDDAAVTGIHITKLKPDGSGKAGTEADKLTIGISNRSPIVLASVNDGMGLAIAEGIEDALSVHHATRLGAWAAGTAGRLPAMADAVQDYVESVTIMIDDDENGRRNANELARRLTERGIEVLMVQPGSRRPGS